MNSYPIDTLRHFTPLVLVSGLAIPEESSGSNLRSRLWAVNGGSVLKSHSSTETREQLATSHQPTDTSHDEDVIMPELFWKFAEKSSDPAIWSPHSLNVRQRQIPYLLNLQFLDSNTTPEYLLPPIKVRRRNSTSTQSQQHEIDDNASDTSRQSVEHVEYQYPSGSLHSELSPLTSTSDLFPDGIISDKWIQKYLYLLPSTFVSIHLLKNAQTREEQVEADDQLVRKINALKGQLGSRNIRIIVIIVSEQLPTEDLTINDRIYSLRKNTGLPARTGLFFLPPSTESQLEALVETVCQLSFNYSFDFYSNLTAQIRRKLTGRPKTLSMSPEDAANMTISPLSHAGWEVRYNFKLGVFAELRQEIDLSTQVFMTTYEMALELFETLRPMKETSDSRWCEFRTLLDTLAFRIVKHHFYKGLPHLAYKKFLYHVGSVSRILDVCGFAHDDFSYKNWRATQYAMLAKLADLAGANLIPNSTPVAPGANEQEPGDCIPRSGFLGLTASELYSDLLNGNYSSPSVTDPYMGASSTELESVKVDLRELLKASIQDFSRTVPQNERSMGYCMYLLGESYLQDKESKTAQGYYKQVAAIYRKDKWNPLMQTVLERLVETSQAIEEFEEGVLAEIELGFSTHTKREPKVEDLMSKLSISDSHDIDLSNNERDIPLYLAEFTFASEECFLGLPIKGQVTLTNNYSASLSSNSSSHYILEEFNVTISGELASIQVVHNESLPVIESGYLSLSNLVLAEETSEYEDRVFKAEANLSFKPGQRIVFEFSQVPKKLGEASFTEITLVAKHENLRLKMKLPMVPNMAGAVPWYEYNGQAVTSRAVRIPNPYRTKLSPRFSLVKVALDKTGPVVLGERLVVNALISSSEPEAVILEIQAKGMTNKGDAMKSKWVTEKEDSTDLLQGLSIPARESTSIPLEIQIPVGSIESVTLEFFISYYSANDEDTIIKDDMVIRLNVLKPFVVNFDVHPRIHTDPWPNFFIPPVFTGEADTSDLGQNPSVCKKWELCASILCLIEGEPVEILGTELDFVSAPGTFCDIVKKPSEQKQRKLVPCI